jgi:Flp pilus assembly protein CpaB
MKRRVYLIAAVSFAIIAAGLTLRAQHTVAVVIATHNVSAGTQLSGSDIQIQSIHEDNVPAGALTTTDEATGKYVSWPLTSGEPILGSALSSQPSGSDVVSGYNIPGGYRAVAIPVTPAGAVGGMLSPGDRVDVYATPNGQGNSSAETASQADSIAPGYSPVTEVIGQDLLVLQLRSDQGQPLDTGSGSSANNVSDLNFGSSKLGSVVVAVPQSQVIQFAAAASIDTMYVALSVS